MTDSIGGNRPRLLEYPICPGFRAFSTMRQGGAGTGTYASMNITHYCDDDPQTVAENRRRLCSVLGIPDQRLFLPRQTHGTRRILIDKDFLQSDTTEQNRRLDDADAIITDEPGVCIGVSTADCIPVLVCDPIRRVSAAIHAGWRGTAARIVALTLADLRDRLGCVPARMHAVIGPGISPEAFEVGDEVYEAFSAADFPMDIIATRRGAKWHIDLPVANFLQLEKAGLRLEHIRMSGICTFGNPDLFFSARRLGIRSGRIFNGILMQ